MSNNTCQSCKWWTMDGFRGDYKGCSNELIRDYSGDDMVDLVRLICV